MELKYDIHFKKKYIFAIFMIFFEKVTTWLQRFYFYFSFAKTTIICVSKHHRVKGHMIGGVLESLCDLGDDDNDDGHDDLKLKDCVSLPALHRFSELKKLDREGSHLLLWWLAN